MSEFVERLHKAGWLKGNGFTIGPVRPATASVANYAYSEAMPEMPHLESAVAALPRLGKVVLSIPFPGRPITAMADQPNSSTPEHHIISEARRRLCAVPGGTFVVDMERVNLRVNTVEIVARWVPRVIRKQEHPWGTHGAYRKSSGVVVGQHQGGRR